MGGKTDLTIAKAMGLVIKKNREKKYPGHGGQAHCAADFGVSPSEWSRWERGVKTPSAANQRSLAAFFGVYIGELWGEEIGAAGNKEAAAPIEGWLENRAPRHRYPNLEEGGDSDNIDHGVVEPASRDQYLNLIASLLGSLWPYNIDMINLLDFLYTVDLAFRKKFGNTYLRLANDSQRDNFNFNNRFFFQLLLSRSPDSFRYDMFRCYRSEMSRFIAETVASMRSLMYRLAYTRNIECVLEYFRDALANFAWCKLTKQTERFFGEGKPSKAGHNYEMCNFLFPINRIFHLDDSQIAMVLPYFFENKASALEPSPEPPGQQYQGRSLSSIFSIYREIQERLGHYIDDIERGTVSADKGRAVFLDLLEQTRRRVKDGPAPEPEPAENSGGIRQKV